MLASSEMIHLMAEVPHCPKTGLLCRKGFGPTESLCSKPLLTSLRRKALEIIPIFDSSDRLLNKIVFIQSSAYLKFILIAHVTLLSTKIILALSS